MLSWMAEKKWVEKYDEVILGFMILRREKPQIKYEILIMQIVSSNDHGHLCEISILPVKRQKWLLGDQKGEHDQKLTMSSLNKILRYSNILEYFFYNGMYGESFTQSAIGESDAMSENIYSKKFDIIGEHIVTAFEQCLYSSSFEEWYTGACRRSIGKNSCILTFNTWGCE